MSTDMQPESSTVKGPEAWFTGDVDFNAYDAGDKLTTDEYPRESEHGA
jgi:hypothetical protein